MSGKTLAFSAGDRICTEGDQLAALFTVQAGAVRACRHARDGRRQIDAFHRAGDVIGLESGQYYTHSLEAVCTTLVTSHPPYRAGSGAGTDGGAVRAMLAHAMAALARAQVRAMLLGRRTAGEKLAGFLLDWASVDCPDDTVTLPMPRHDIADYLGITPETVSRELHDLQRRGLIRLLSARRIMFADPTGLRRLSGAGVVR